MRDRFIGWYPWSPEQASAIWDAAIFVPDANILLHCLRHPEGVREQLLRLFDILKDSLWIPHQIGLEFQRNRLDVEVGSRDAYDQISGDCTTALQRARSRLQQIRAHPVISVEREVAALDRFIADFQKRLKADKDNHPAEAIATAVDRLTDLLNGRIGEKWKPDQLNDLRKEGQERYANRIPPGYMDSKKDAGPNNKFGDLIIWKDMMAKAKVEERPVVFISDDAKEDWWWIHRGRKLGARPELIEEFREVSGQPFHIYEFGQFLRIAAGRHPEIKAGVAVIEKSLRGDKQAKRRIDDAEEAKALRVRISELEHERDMVISSLSGTPMRGDIVKSSADRTSLRSRLDELNTELETMGAAPTNETDPEP